MIRSKMNTRRSCAGITPCFMLALLAVVGLLSGCGLLSPAKPEPPQEPRPVASMTAASPEVQQKFAKAHVLWKGTDVCTDPAMAIVLLDEVIAQQPDYADAYMWRGLAYSELGKSDESFADLTQAIRLDPRPDRYAYRALALIRLENFPGARRDLNASLTMDDAHHRAWNFRGALNTLEQNTEAACADFEQGCKRGDCSGLNAAKKQGLCR